MSCTHPNLPRQRLLPNGSQGITMCSFLLPSTAGGCNAGPGRRRAGRVPY